MNDRPIYISTEDHAKIRLLLESLGPSQRSAAVQNLRSELDRAIILDGAAVPASVVTMNSRFEIEDLKTGEVEDYTLVFPEHANMEQRMISLFAPIGTAVLGFSEGNEVEWTTPGGVRRFRIRKVLPPASALAR